MQWLASKFCYDDANWCTGGTLHKKLVAGKWLIYPFLAHEIK